MFSATNTVRRALLSFKLCSHQLGLHHRAFVSPNESVPIITVPQYLQRRIRKIRVQAERDPEIRRAQLSVVTCKRSQFNQYRGQTFGRFVAVPLASRAWVNRKSVGDFFVINSHGRTNPSITAEGQSFDEFGLRREIVERLNNMRIKCATNIQALAIPQLLEGANAIIASETGSGKTLAYLVPCVNHVLNIKDNSNRSGLFCTPLAVVLTPGRELAVQIHATLKLITESLNINTALFLGGLGTKSLLLHPKIDEVDIVVASFGVFSKLVSSGVYDISDVKHVIIDEADTMLDDSFNEKVVHLLKKFKFLESVKHENHVNTGPQLCLVGATFPRSLDTILDGILPMQSFRQIKTSNLHRLMSHVSQKFVRVRKMDKPAELLRLVQEDVKVNHQVIVFSKNSATSVFVSRFLEENGVKVTNFHGNMNAKVRHGKFEQFLRHEVDVLSCTDLASRGLDTGKVHHIINYDFPYYMSDYIHRTGRTGRVGGTIKGHVTNLISSGTEVALVNKIEIAARKCEELPNVNANIQRQMKKSQSPPQMDYKPGT